MKDNRLSTAFLDQFTGVYRLNLTRVKLPAQAVAAKGAEAPFAGADQQSIRFLYDLLDLQRDHQKQQEGHA